MIYSLVSKSNKRDMDKLQIILSAVDTYSESIDGWDKSMSYSMLIAAVFTFIILQL